MGVKGCAIHLSFSPGNGVLMRDNTPKSTRTQGGDPIADYIRADTRLPAYLPYPRFLLKMEISQTAQLLYSLLCRWFTAAVLPLDEALEAALLRRGSRKRCAVCGAFFFPKSNRGKYCPDCAGRMKKLKAAERKRKQRHKCHALEPFKPA